MEPTRTQIKLPIDAWGFDQDEIWIKLQGVRIKIPYPNYFIQVKTPELYMEIEGAQPKESSIK